MMKFLSRALKILSMAFILTFSVQQVVPSVASAAVNTPCHNSGGFLGMPTWYEYLEIENLHGDSCAITGPKDPSTGKFSMELALPRIGLAVIDILLRVAGMVAIIFVIMSGFRYMTSQGEPEGAKKAQATAANALIGLAIAVLSSSIVGFIGSRLW